MSPNSAVRPIFIDAGSLAQYLLLLYWYKVRVIGDRLQRHVIQLVCLQTGNTISWEFTRHPGFNSHLMSISTMLAAHL